LDRRRATLLSIGGFIALLGPSALLAQSKERVIRVGLLWTGSRESASLRAAFSSGLKDRGYLEGRNVTFLDRSNISSYEDLPAAARSLVEAKVDVILTTGTIAVHAARAATSTIPIVMVGPDPVGEGLAKSLSRPGGNVTGVATLTSELLGKRLELLKETVPNLRKVAALHNPLGEVKWLSIAQGQARRLQLQLNAVEARKLEDLPQAISNAAQSGAGALYVIPSTMLTANRQTIASLALKHRLPTIGTTLEWVDAGALLAYGPNFQRMFQRAADYVVRIVKGEVPAEMSIDQASEIELAVNLKTAKALGVRIPEVIRFRATRLVE
jgi:putative ABC transport system substrate-binding protein